MAQAAEGAGCFPRATDLDPRARHRALAWAAEPLRSLPVQADGRVLGLLCLRLIQTAALSAANTCSSARRLETPLAVFVTMGDE